MIHIFSFTILIWLILLLPKNTKQEKLTKYHSIKIFNNNFYSVLNPAEFMSEDQISSFSIDKQDEDTEIYMKDHKINFIRLFSNSKFFINNETQIIKTCLIRAGKGIKQKFLYVLTKKKISIFQQILNNKDVPFKLIYTEHINNFPGTVCNLEDETCEFTTAMAPSSQPHFYLYLEFTSNSSISKNSRMFLIALNLNSFLRNEKNVVVSEPLQIEKLFLKAKLASIHFPGIKKKIPCKANYRSLYYLRLGKTGGFVRFCKMNQENIDQKIANNYRNKLEFYVYHGNKQSPFKAGEMFRYDFYGQKKFSDSFLMVHSIEVLKGVVILFDKRGYGYSKIQLERNFNFRVVEDYDLYEAYCGKIRGSSLSCAMVSWKKERKENKCVGKNMLYAEDKNIELLELVAYEDSLLKVDIKNITLIKPCLLSVLNFDYNVLFLAADFDGKRKKMQISTRRKSSQKTTVFYTTSRFAVGMNLLALGSADTSLHNGDGIISYYKKDRNEFFFKIFSSTIPAIFLKPRVDLENSFCDNFLNHCAPTNITLRPKNLNFSIKNEFELNSNYTIRGYVIDEKFQSVISKTPSRVVKPNFSQGKFYINIDDFYFGTLVNPRVVTYGDIHHDFIMRQDRILAKSTSQFLQDFERVFFPKTMKEIFSKLDFSIKKSKYFHSKNIDESINWAIAAPFKEGKGYALIRPSKAELFVPEDSKIQERNIIVSTLPEIDRIFFINSFEDDCIHFIVVKNEKDKEIGGINVFIWENKKICNGEIKLESLRLHETKAEILKVVHSKNSNDKILSVITKKGALFYESSKNLDLNFLDFKSKSYLTNLDFKRFFNDFEKVLDTKIVRVEIIDIAFWHSKYILVVVNAYQKNTSATSRLIILHCDFSTLNCEFFGYIQIADTNGETRDIIYLSQSSETIVILRQNYFILTAFRLDFDRGILENESKSEEIFPIQNLTLRAKEGFMIRKIFSFIDQDSFFFTTKFDMVVLFLDIIEENHLREHQKQNISIFKISIEKGSLLNIRRIQPVENFDSKSFHTIPFDEEESDSKIIQIFEISEKKFKIKYYWNSNSLMLESDYNFKTQSSNLKTKDISIRFNDREDKTYEEVFTVELRSGFELNLPQYVKFLGRNYNIRPQNWGVVRKMGFYCKHGNVRYKFNNLGLEGLQCDRLQVTMRKMLKLTGSVSNLHKIWNEYGEVRGFRTKRVKINKKEHYLFVVLTERKLLYGTLHEKKISLKGDFRLGIVSSAECFSILPIKMKEDGSMEIRVVCKKNSTLLKVNVQADDIEKGWANPDFYDPNWNLIAHPERLTIPNFVTLAIFQSFRFAFVDDYFFIVKKIFLTSKQPKYYLNIYRILYEGDKIHFNFLYTSLSEKYLNFNALSFYVEKLKENAETAWYDLILIKKSLDEKSIMIECVRIMMTKSTLEMAIKKYESYQKKTFDLNFISYARIVPKSRSGLDVDYVILLVNQERIYEVQLTNTKEPGEFPYYNISFELKYIHIGLCPTGSRFRVKYALKKLFFNCLSFKLHSTKNLVAIYDRRDKLRRDTRGKRKYIVFPKDKVTYEVGPEVGFFEIRIHPRFSMEKGFNKLYVATAHTLIDEFEIGNSIDIGLKNVTRNLLKSSQNKGYYLSVENLFQKFEIRMKFSIRSFFKEERIALKILKKYYELFIILGVYGVCIFVLTNIIGIKLSLFSKKIVRLNKEYEMLRVNEMTRKTLHQREEFMQRERRVSNLY